MGLNYLVIIVLFLWIHAINGQAQVLVETQDRVLMPEKKVTYNHLMDSKHFDFKMQSQVSFPAVVPLSKSNYHPNHLPGLFCKLEYKIELKSKLAPRFRLGSLQYTDWLEGKQDYNLRHSP